MSPAVSVAKAKPALGAGAMVDGDDIGTAVGVVLVFLRVPELEEPLSHTHYVLHETHFPILAAKRAFFEFHRYLSFNPFAREPVWFLHTFLRISESQLNHFSKCFYFISIRKIIILILVFFIEIWIIRYYYYVSLSWVVN